MMLPDGNHPIWRIISNVISLLVILLLTSADFDVTELQAVLAFFAMNGLSETVFRNRRNGV